MSFDSLLLGLLWHQISKYRKVRHSSLSDYPYMNTSVMNFSMIRDLFIDSTKMNNRYIPGPELHIIIVTNSFITIGDSVWSKPDFTDILSMVRQVADGLKVSGRLRKWKLAQLYHENTRRWEIIRTWKHTNILQYVTFVQRDNDWSTSTAWWSRFHSFKNFIKLYKLFQQEVLTHHVTWQSSPIFSIT